MKYILIILFLAAVFIIALGILINQNIRLKKEKQALEIKSILAECENNKSLRQIRHDVINQSFTVDMLLQKGDIKEAREFLKGGEGRLKGIIPQNFCTSYIINGILLFENNKCKENGITLNCKANASSDDFKPSDGELCIIFNTLFDLAIKNTEDKSIDLVCKRVNNTLFIYLAFCGKLKSSNLKKIKPIVNKYDGRLEINNKNNKSEIKIFI